MTQTGATGIGTRYGEATTCLRNILCLAAVFVTAAALALPAFPAEKSILGVTVPSPTPQQPEATETLSVTQHSIKVNGQSLRYTATAGRLSVRDSIGQPQAFIFFASYVLKPAKSLSRRPITFAFNGGPGASSMWLHLAAAGPRRALFGAEGTKLPAVDTLIDNQYSWLPFTDLVFVDPIGTGFSRAAPEVAAEKFYTVESDIKVMAEFVRLYLSRFDRWLSPKFIAGESYGTTRAAGLCDYLQSVTGTAMTGLIFISSALDFQVLSFDPGNDLPYALALPSYTAAAWYHEQLPPAVKRSDLRATLAAAERFALGDYLMALRRGGALPGPERSVMIDSLAAYTGLTPSYIRTHDLRIDSYRFTEQLLRAHDSTIGMLDSRVAAVKASPWSRYPFTDPAMFVVAAPLTAIVNHYLRTDLGFTTSLEYVFFSDAINHKWQWAPPGSQGYLTMTPSLHDALAANGRLRVFAATGYYDLASPFLSQRYVFDHVGPDSALLSRIVQKVYPAGHQIYTHIPSLKQLSSDIEDFVRPRP